MGYFAGLLVKLPAVIYNADMFLFNAWQFTLSCYLISIVLFFQLYKAAVTGAKHDGAATILLQIVGSTAAVLLMPFFSFTIPTDWKTYVLLLAACVFYALNDRMQTTARRELQVSTIAVLNQMTNVFLILIGVLVFHEALVGMKLLGAGLILLANFLLVYSKGKVEINKHTLVAVAANLFFAVAISIDIGISELFNLPFYIVVTLGVPGLFIALLEKISFKQIAAEFVPAKRKTILAAGTIWTLVILFSLRTFQLGEVTTVVPLQASSVLLSIILAFFWFGEKENWLKKIVAGLLVLAGVTAIVMG